MKYEGEVRISFGCYAWISVEHVRRSSVVAKTHRTTHLEGPNSSTGKCIVQFFDPLYYVIMLISV